MCNNKIFSMLFYCRFWWGSFCSSCSSCDMWNCPKPPELSQKPICSLCVKFQLSSTPPSDRFWWGVLVVVLVVLVTGVKQSQLLVLRLSLEFDNNKKKNTNNPSPNLSEGGVLEGWNLTHRLQMGFRLSLGG